MIHCTGLSLYAAMQRAAPFVERGGHIIRCINEQGRWTITIISGAH